MYFLASIPTSQQKVDIINIQDKCIIVGDKTVCSRFAHDGLLLLDTVFQPCVSKNTNVAFKNPIKTLEISVNDALNLLTGLKSIEIDSISGLDEFIASIEKQMGSLMNSAQGSEQAWASVKLTETHTNFIIILTQSLEEIKRNNMQSVAIPSISLLLDRLYRLDLTLVDNSQSSSSALFGNSNLGAIAPISSFDKRYMCSEANRRATFNEWPHMDYKWVLPDALAQAGFYHQPTHPGDDRTICFVCDLCLVAWEQHDQPWCLFFFHLVL